MPNKMSWLLKVNVRGNNLWIVESLSKICLLKSGLYSLLSPYIYSCCVWPCVEIFWPCLAYTDHVKPHIYKSHNTPVQFCPGSKAVRIIPIWRFLIDLSYVSNVQWCVSPSNKYCLLNSRCMFCWNFRPGVFQPPRLSWNVHQFSLLFGFGIPPKSCILADNTWRGWCVSVVAWPRSLSPVL